MSNTMTTAKRVIRVILAVISSIVLIGAFAVLAVVDLPHVLVDAPGTSLAADHDIVQQRLTAYCPARMRLSDSTDWGDSDYRASEGDLATTATYAAFGSVYASTASSFDVGSGDDVTLEAPANAGREDAMVAKDADGVSRTLSTNLLQAGVGSGHAGVIASHASDGDLRGISAGTCTTPAVSQSFLLTATTTGVTQQLVIANPSSKATGVTIAVTGSERSGRMGLATAGSTTVEANAETTIDLSAAASGQNGLYVTVTSDATPVAAVVRTLAADGLTPKGSDFAMPLERPSGTVAIPSVAEGDRTTLYLHAAKATRTRLSWMTDDGPVAIRTVKTDADRVDVIDLGAAPKGAHAILVEAGAKVSAMTKAVRAGASGQEDFALLGAPAASASTGTALPDGYDADVVLANTGDADSTAHVTVMDADGNAGDVHDVAVKAHAAVTMKASGSAVVVADADDTVVWGVRLTGAGLDTAKTAGLAAVTPTALAVREENVASVENHGIVR
ncbi:hypothetical protein JS531_00670 [Bifidobacterium sp. CP2]|uniref:DUF5719 family protein n=1 Tax=Bifidobacterium sp. CP2 TaxID=2809025 RepID=UPI001BDBDC28|nr:DUF5719 family protein [Bifidobacterium sp. CP2]MBT1180511.1 hypothetical protein [Bifidobacterium sp. CP2]